MNLLGPNFKGVVQIPVQSQTNGSECGVFTIVFATCLVHRRNLCNVLFDIPKMCQHLLKCLKNGSMTTFPTTCTLKHSVNSNKK